jgi:cyclic beta-1,2-glucan synthetase
MYRAGIESMLGLRRRGQTFSVDPCIPSSWPEYTMTWRVGRTTYMMTVINPDRHSRGVLSATLDGKAIDAGTIPLMDDGQTHDIRVVLGRH